MLRALARLIADAVLVASVLFISAGTLAWWRGWGIKALALRANAFATAVVRVQREREHAVVDAGVYGIVRHPFYSGTPLVLVGLSLWLESYAAGGVAALPPAFLVVCFVLGGR